MDFFQHRQPDIGQYMELLLDGQVPEHEALSNKIYVRRLHLEEDLELSGKLGAWARQKLY